MILMLKTLKRIIKISTSHVDTETSQFRPWTKKDEDKLKIYLEEKKDVNEITQLMRRAKSSINMRIASLKKSSPNLKKRIKPKNDYMSFKWTKWTGVLIELRLRHNVILDDIAGITGISIEDLRDRCHKFPTDSQMDIEETKLLIFLLSTRSG